MRLAAVAVALCGLALAVWGLFFRLGGSFRPDPSGAPDARAARADRVSQVLAVGACVMLAASVFAAATVPVHSAHEIAIVVPMTAVLGGRLVGPWLSGARRAAAGARRPLTDVARIPVAFVLAVAGACYLGVLGYTAAQSARQPPTPTLASWLLAHRLTSGLAGYWVANLTTLDADGHVLIAGVSGGGTAANAWESEATWYNPADSAANFVVLAPVPPSTANTPPLAAVRAFYGKPARTYRFQQYTVLVYDYNVLRRLHQFYYP